MRAKGVTLVEVLLAFAIFVMVMSLVTVSLVQTFHSFQQGQKFADKEQQQRLCLMRMGKSIASLVKLVAPGKSSSLRGDAQSCFIIYARDASLAEEKYVCDTAEGTLTRYYEEPTDYNEATSGTHDIGLAGLDECLFSYSDGSSWKAVWNQQDGVPRAVKLKFKFKDDTQEHEFLTNIPISP